MIRVLNSSITENALQVFRMSKEIKSRFSRQEIIDDFPKQKLVSIMELGIPDVVPVETMRRGVGREPGRLIS